MKSYFDIVGDGGSGILDQVLAQRDAIERNLEGVGSLLAVGSGKGGVGKSTVALQLSRAMAARGATCAVLDADLNGPSQAHMSGLAGTPLLPGRSGLAMPRTSEGIGVISLGSAIPVSRDLELDSVAQGSTQTWRATREFTLFGELLATVEWGALDVLLIDLPPGAERTFQFAEFLGDRAAFVLVTAPSALSRGVVSRSRAALSRARGELLGLVVNMDGYYCSKCGEVKPLFPSAGLPHREARGTAVESESGLRLLGSIPFDPELAARCDRGEPTTGLESSPALQQIDRIASELLSDLETRRRTAGSVPLSTVIPAEESQS